MTTLLQNCSPRSIPVESPCFGVAFFGVAIFGVALGMEPLSLDLRHSTTRCLEAGRPTEPVRAYDKWARTERS